MLKAGCQPRLGRGLIDAAGREISGYTVCGLLAGCPCLACNQINPAAGEQLLVKAAAKLTTALFQILERGPFCSRIGQQVNIAAGSVLCHVRIGIHLIWVPRARLQLCPEIAFGGPHWGGSAIELEQRWSERRKSCHFFKFGYAFRVQAQIQSARPSAVDHRGITAHLNFPISFHAQPAVSSR